MPKVRHARHASWAKSLLPCVRLYSCSKSSTFKWNRTKSGYGVNLANSNRVRALIPCAECRAGGRNWSPHSHCHACVAEGAGIGETAPAAFRGRSGFVSLVLRDMPRKGRQGGWPRGLCNESAGARPDRDHENEWRDFSGSADAEDYSVRGGDRIAWAARNSGVGANLSESGPGHGSKSSPSRESVEISGVDPGEKQAVRIARNRFSGFRLIRCYRRAAISDG